MKIFDAGWRVRCCESFSRAFVGPLHRTAKLLAIELIERPAIDVGMRSLQHWERLSLPFRKRSHEILQLEHEHAFELCIRTPPPALGNSLKLSHGLQTHLRIADLLCQSFHIAQTTILLPELSMDVLLAYQAHRRTR